MNLPSVGFWRAEQNASACGAKELVLTAVLGELQPCGAGALFRVRIFYRRCFHARDDRFAGQRKKDDVDECAFSAEVGSENKIDTFGEFKIAFALKTAEVAEDDFLELHISLPDFRGAYRKAFAPAPSRVRSPM